MKYLVTPSWLLNQLDRDNLRIVDCRFHLENPEQGRKEYRDAHIPGAVYFDLEKDMSAPVGIHGGRHPLPEIDDFANCLSEAGIDQDTTVIAYDNQGGAMAARFWWMLRYLGHQKTFILDRSFSHWEQLDYPLEQEVPFYENKKFTPQLEPNNLVHLEEVKLSLQQDEIQLIDGRDDKRYEGIEDNVDGVPGHIPGAKQYFWKDVLDENGVWKNTEKLQAHFKNVADADQIVSYCGSGVTACVNVLALMEAGYNSPRLYAGSWSDWTSYDDLPISKG
ncbi:thiosulfate/3-mercaptopyruvate sulfurtransferase [Salibacterium salarium]|uniref:sulfurtransferase n=1 Tax=Salibacterium salarium TaxID=284579 RepID=UPI00278A65DD|nr:sulfurtransferase [Salibacterium salarium]MDQ0299394.1 thiosulfate/3-mercaptopyruvate sulfurtransferase [Salibacterium salarium]